MLHHNTLNEKLRPSIFHRIRIFLVLSFFLAACSVLKSDLTVQPGKQFELGGNQNGAFTVQVENKGKVPVTITELKAGGEKISLGVFAPGAQQTIKFSSGSAALVDNASDKPARLTLVVSGDKSLSMTERNP